MGRVWFSSLGFSICVLIVIVICNRDVSAEAPQAVTNQHVAGISLHAAEGDTTAVPNGSTTAAAGSKMQRKLLQSADPRTAVKQTLKRDIAPWEPQNATFVVPPGAGRMLVLESPPKARFKVTLSATPRYLPSSGDTFTGLQPMRNWQTDPQCGSNGLLAAAYRKDLVPAHISKSTSPLLKFARQRNAAEADRALLSQLNKGCNRPEDVTYPGNTTYGLPVNMLGELISANTAAIKMQNGSMPAGVPFVPRSASQLVGWPQLGKSDQLPPASDSSQPDCQRQLYELTDYLGFNITLPGPEGFPERRECGNSDRSQVVSYVHNCYLAGEQDMVVRVSIDVQDQQENICDTGVSWAVQSMCLVAVIMMASVAAVCIIPQGCVAAYSKIVRHRQRKSAAAQAKKDSSGKEQAVTGTTHASVQRPSQAAPRQAQGASKVQQLVGWYQACHDVLSTLNNPSGHSRCYTIFVTTSAALLVAAIVWAPAKAPSAVHDYAFSGDVWIIPRKGDGSLTAGIMTSTWAESVWYYLKVMALSACVGHTVKLALLSNMSPPGPMSKGIRVSYTVWRRQVVLSVGGLALLAFVVGSYTLSMAVLRGALEITAAHWYLVAVMWANFAAAVGYFIHYTFRQPPPLTSETAKAACDLCNKPTASSTNQQQLLYGMLPKNPAIGKGSKNMQAASHDQMQKDRVSSTMAHTGVPKRTPNERLGAVVGWFKLQLWEHDDFTYSSWVITPVWLTVLLVFFWWARGVINASIVVDCLQDPVECSGGLIPFTLNAVPYQSQVLDMMATSTEALQLSQQVASALSQLSQLPNSGGRSTTDSKMLQLNRTMARLAKGMEERDREAQAFYKTAYSVQQFAGETLATAERVGRWLGYTTSLILALYSLFNIVKTFKRVLFLRVFLSKSPDEQAAIVDGLKEKHSVDARLLACAMDTSADHRDEDTAEAPHEIIPFSFSTRGGLRHRGSTVAPLQLSGSHSPHAAAQDSPGFASTASCAVAPGFQSLELQPCSTLPVSPFEAPQNIPACAAQSFKRGPTLRKTASVRFDEGAGGQLSVTTSAASTTRPSREDSIIVTIAQDIQRLEVDMARFGIGASTALFGVLASVMWIQIRFIGLILTFAFTLICHKEVWIFTWNKGLWGLVITVICIVLFNMLVIKRFIGSKLLSDGANIKHRGAWMTFYIMFQFCFMVLGTLYATWRIVLALVSILLFAVAALDRSLMHMFTLLDGPYIAFVTSIKLEQSYRDITLRDADAEGEAEEARLLQQVQEENEQQGGAGEGGNPSKDVQGQVHVDVTEDATRSDQGDRQQSHRVRQQQEERQEGHSSVTVTPGVPAAREGGAGAGGVVATTPRFGEDDGEPHQIVWACASDCIGHPTA